MLGGEGAGVAGGLGEADEHERERSDGPDTDVVPHQRQVGHDDGRQAARDVSDECHAAVTETQQPRGQQTADHQHQRPRHLGRDDTQPEDDGERDAADHDRRAVLLSPSVVSHDHSSWNELLPETFVPVSLGSSPMTTSSAAPKRKPVTTARERNCAIHPILSTATSRYSSPDASVIPATNDATAFSSTMPAARTALAATAASPELGPTEICRLVPKIA